MRVAERVFVRMLCRGCAKLSRCQRGHGELQRGARRQLCVRLPLKSHAYTIRCTQEFNPPPGDLPFVGLISQIFSEGNDERLDDYEVRDALRGAFAATESLSAR